MDISHLKRDSRYVFSQFSQTEDGVLMTKTGCKIVIPARFVERDLALVGSDTRTVGICAWIVEDKYYGITMTNAIMPLTPSSTSTTMIDGDGYIVFTFDPGTVVCPNMDLVKDDLIVYRIFDEVITKARVPWYINYLDLGKIFRSAQKHAGTNIGAQREVTELIVAMGARFKDNRVVYYRQVLENLNDIFYKPPVYTSLKSVEFSATNTTNRLVGSYMSRGFVSALNNPSERQERMEELLRK